MTAVLVTRPSGADDPLVARLAAVGIRVHAVPTVATEPVPPGSVLDAAVGRIATFDWVVVTSPTGARAVVDAMTRTGGDPAERAGRTRWAAAGWTTAEVLEQAGIGVGAVPPEAGGRAVADAILATGPVAGRRILLARADAAGPELPRALTFAGAVVEAVVAYRTVAGPGSSRPALLGALADPDLALAIVASGSAVEGLVALATGTPFEARARSLPLVSIGPATSAAVERLGLVLAAQAATSSTDGLLDAVLRTLDSDPAATPTGGPA